MAGGFAHEMRNALTAAKMLLSIALRRGDDGETKSLCADNGEALFVIYQKLDGHVDSRVLDELAPLLRDVNTNEERLDNVLRRVWASIERALGTTQAILEYAKLGGERPGDAPILLAPLLQAIAAESGADFEANGISLEVDVGPDVHVSGKDEHWYSILKNLVLNARDALCDVDRAEGRKILVTAEVRGERLVVSVADNGVGIPLEDVARIFEPFFSTKPDTGTGLGLGVVRKLVALYGGTIDVSSEPGRGTRVSFALPPP
jgi:signal transduction histidine kinase